MEETFDSTTVEDKDSKTTQGLIKTRSVVRRSITLTKKKFSDSLLEPEKLRECDNYLSALTVLVKKQDLLSQQIQALLDPAHKNYETTLTKEIDKDIIRFVRKYARLSSYSLF